VLVIARDPRELEKLYRELKGALINVADRVMTEEDHLQRFRERDENGVLLKDQWDDIVARATQRFGLRDASYCCVTVTDYFGGRGHDFNVMDEKANNEHGGMLVIATTVPDTREWIQWKGRTARQDRPGQFVVVLSKSDDPFQRDRQYMSEFKKLSHNDRIYAENGLLRKKDVWIQ